MADSTNVVRERIVRVLDAERRALLSEIRRWQAKDQDAEGLTRLAEKLKEALDEAQRRD